jgi:hypothetical protein
MMFLKLGTGWLCFIITLLHDTDASNERHKILNHIATESLSKARCILRLVSRYPSHRP